MINPIRLCEDVFDDPKLSYANLRAFTEDHLVSLANPLNNPGGIYNVLITDTTTKYNNYYGKISNELVKKALAEGTTVTRNDARKAVEAKIKGLQGGTVLRFGDKSAAYQELFPLGMDEYYQAREGNIGSLFDRFLTAATARLNADFPADVVEVSTLIASFHTAYAVREAVVSEVDTAQTGKHEDRKILTVQLTVNFLTIAIQNIDNPDRFDDYYDPRFLPLNGNEEPEILLEQDVAIAGEGVTNVPIIHFEMEGDYILTITSPPTNPLVGVGFSADTTSLAEPTNIDAGSTLQETAFHLGFSESTPNLNFKNEFAIPATVHLKIRRA